MSPLDTDSPNKTKDKPLTKAGKKREATKAALIEALEQIVVEDGIGTVGVNAIAKRAGVGKPLIYKYFGGFDGLVRAWAAQSKVWGSDEDIFALLSDAPDADPVPLIRDYLTRSATELRSKPIALQVMAQSLLTENEFTAGLEAAKDDSGRHHNALYEKGGVFDDPDMSALLMVMYAASQYLALRSLTQSNFNGISLDSEDGWTAMMQMMNRVFDNAVKGARTGN